MPFSKRVLAGIAALIAVLAGGGAVVLSVIPDDPAVAPASTTVTLGGPGKQQIVLTPDAQKILGAQKAEDAAGKTVAAESDLSQPALTDPAAIDDSLKLRPDGQPTIPPTVPLASANVEGCTTKLVRNYSSRRGAPVLLGVLHWTGSRPTPGSPASGLAIVSWFDQAAAQASSSEITDQDGRCWLAVPESQKAWTQAAFNPWSVSVEIVNQGVQPVFQTAKARAAVVRLMRGWHARWSIPYRRGQVTQNGCRVVRSGFLDHQALGSCGGGHPDLGSFDVDGLIREAADGGVAATDKATCRKINAWRHAGRPKGGAWERNTVRRRRALDKRHVTCLTSGPAKT